ncbi:hypothetical protein FH972_023521 [Carpinus fangiana]|uniref:Obg domain-containing protein n=1 Tax=Carpinus fangiana TaxID=176857 RepID=A0A5N6KVE5_9ROSI|nr:hypothetical protein FH972_023521 [Carpinus fangiana]
MDHDDAAAIVLKHKAELGAGKVVASGQRNTSGIGHWGCHWATNRHARTPWPVHPRSNSSNSVPTSRHLSTARTPSQAAATMLDTLTPFLYPCLLRQPLRRSVQRCCHSNNIFKRPLVRQSARTFHATPCPHDSTSTTDPSSSPTPTDNTSPLPAYGTHLNPTPDSYASTPFADRCTLTLHAGAGGHGCVSFLREKYIEQGPPNGGDGGSGGNIYIQAVPGETSLHKLARRGTLKAGRGRNGRGKGRGGERGEDVLFTVPPGTVVRELWRVDPVEEERLRVLEEKARRKAIRAALATSPPSNEQPFDGDSESSTRDSDPHAAQPEEAPEPDPEDTLDDEAPQWKKEKWIAYPGMTPREMRYMEAPLLPRKRTSTQQALQPTGPIRLDLDSPMDRPLLLAAGASGGVGNPHFVTATTPRPKFATRGDPGMRLALALELKTLADVGLVGLPNAGDAVEALKALWREVGAYETLRAQEVNAESEARLEGGAHEWVEDGDGGRVTLPSLVLPPVSAKPWFVVASKADREGAEAEFAALRDYIARVRGGEEEHPSGRKNGWKSGVRVVPISAIRVVDQGQRPVGPAAGTGDEAEYGVAGGQRHVAGLAGQDGLGHLAADVLGGHERVVDLLEAALDPALDEGGLDPVGVDGGGLDEGGVVAVLELLRQALVEGHRAGLCAAVVDHAGDGRVRGHGGGRDDVALLALDHVGQELAHGVPVGDQVDVEDLLKVGIGHVDDVEGLADAGVVDQDRGGADLLTDALGNLVHVGRDWSAKHTAGDGRRGRRQVDDANLHAGGDQLLDHLGRQATAAASDDADLISPDPWAAGLAKLPVVQGPLVQPVVDAADDAEGEEPLDGLDNGLRVNGEGQGRQRTENAGTQGHRTERRRGEELAESLEIKTLLRRWGFRQGQSSADGTTLLSRKSACTVVWRSEWWGAAHDRGTCGRCGWTTPFHSAATALAATWMHRSQ